MAPAPAFADWVREHLAGLAPIEIKPMFGAASVYAEGLIFALLEDGVIWMKADDENQPALEAEGARQISYTSKDGRVMLMPYWSLPDSAVDDADEAVAWARRSLDAARRKAALKTPRKR